MIYECTDCEHCASFDHGYRIWCANPELPAWEAYEHYPLAQFPSKKADARECNGFSEGEPHYFTADELEQAFVFSDDFDELETGIRAWIDIQLGRQP